MYEYKSLTAAEFDELFETTARLTGFLARARRKRIRMTHDELKHVRQKLVDVGRQCLELEDELPRKVSELA